LAKIGDKTQVATIMLAAWFDNLVAVVLGTGCSLPTSLRLACHRMGNRVPLKAIRFVAADLFGALGV
jgi:putative Ca2+/H+ antiporter (TMEM165/GDT1 family)